MFRVRFVLALMAAVAAAGLVKCAHGGGGADFVPSLTVGDKWKVKVSYIGHDPGITPRPGRLPDSEETDTVEYEVVKDKEVTDAEGATVAAYVIRVPYGTTTSYWELVVRKDTFTLVRWYSVNHEGKKHSVHDNKPSEATFTSTVQEGRWNSTAWIDFPRFPEEAKNETRKLKFHRTAMDGEPGYKVTQETKFTGNVMEITITAKYKNKRQRKVYIKWEKGKKWWSESAKWELDKDGKEVKYSRHTAKLVETP